MMMAGQAFPYLGFGLGLRTAHYQTIIQERPPIDWFEIVTEDFLVAGGKPHYFLNQIREHYPIVMHGVSLSIGSTDPLNIDYLQKVKKLAESIRPAWISDHLCWTGVQGINLHDLLPLPYTEEVIQHVVERISRVQDTLGRQILLENVSSYISFTDSQLTEWEFLNEIIRRADCYLLLDINNIFVSSFNHGFDPHTYINHIDAKRVQQFHLAGHTHMGDHIIDTHDEAIIDSVWKLYAVALQRFGPISTMIERDDNIPPLKELMVELNQAKAIAEQVFLRKAELCNV
jgi:uncharacterized protein